MKLFVYSPAGQTLIKMQGLAAGETQRECGQSDPVHSEKLFAYFFSEKVGYSENILVER